MRWFAIQRRIRRRGNGHLNPALPGNPKMVGEKKKTALILAFSPWSCFSPHTLIRPSATFSHSRGRRTPGEGIVVPASGQSEGLEFALIWWWATGEGLFRPGKPGTGWAEKWIGMDSVMVENCWA